MESNKRKQEDKKTFEPIVPYLDNATDSFAKQSQKRIALAAARYYGECAMHGISHEDANNAAEQLRYI